MRPRFVARRAQAVNLRRACAASGPFERYDAQPNRAAGGIMREHTATPFLSDIQEIRRRAREHVEKGAVTSAYKGDLVTVVKLLNEALATEIVCTLRYRRHHYMAAGIHYQAIADEFMEHANEEQQHADQIAERIRQLGGAPDF
ncbi:MAG: bacterioferritin, partial [Myxococcales bacterium]